jgi:hypothetical protein
MNELMIFMGTALGGSVAVYYACRLLLPKKWRGMAKLEEELPTQEEEHKGEQA